MSSNTAIGLVGDRRLGHSLMSIGVVLCGLLLCALPARSRPAPSPLHPWRVITPESTEHDAYPLQPPFLLEDAVIWRGFEDGLLRYAAFEGGQPFIYDWLRGQPVEWAASESDGQVFLVWRNERRELWLALLSARGEQLTAPILVTGEAETFTITPYNRDNLLILWRWEGQLWMNIVDRGGRPREDLPLADSVEAFAARVEAPDTLNLAWQASNQIFYASLPIPDPFTAPAIGNPLTLEAALPADSWLSGLFLMESGEQQALLWGITEAGSPDRETYAGVLLPRSGLAQPEPFTLTLPGNPPLRWARPAGGRLGLAAYLDEGWQAVSVDFDTGGAQGYRLIEGEAVTGSEPTLRGNHAGWVTLSSEEQPRLFLTTLDPRFGASVLPETATDWRADMRQGLARSPYGLLWGVLPVLAIFLLRRGELSPLLAYRLPILLGLYWLSKALIPPGLFDVPPAALPPVADWPPFWAVFLPLMGVALIAGLLGFIRRGQFAALTCYATYCLTDMLLTFAIFGSSVE